MGKSRGLRDPYFKLSKKLDYLAQDIGGLWQRFSEVKRSITELKADQSKFMHDVEQYFPAISAAESLDKSGDNKVPEKVLSE